MNFLLIFLTGLTTGGLACLAVQGGLLASVISNQKEDEEQGVDAKAQNPRSFDALDWQPVTIFLLAKLFIHTVLGFLLGALGTVLALNLETRLLFQFAAALFMFATAMNLLNVHPIFRFVVLQPPKFIQRLIKNSTKSKALFTPAILGLLTVLIPCGVTQAMELVAINSGSPILGPSRCLFCGHHIFSRYCDGETKSERALFQFTAVFIFMVVWILTACYVLDVPVTTKNINCHTKQNTAWYGNNTQTVKRCLPNGEQTLAIIITSNGYAKITVMLERQNLRSNDKDILCPLIYTQNSTSLNSSEPTGRKLEIYTQRARIIYLCMLYGNVSGYIGGHLNVQHF
jgi:sulfite exporter TauE/SafE